MYHKSNGVSDMLKYDQEFEKMSIKQLEEFCECRYLEEQYAHEMRSQATAVLRRKLSIMTAEEEMIMATERYHAMVEEIKAQDDTSLVQRILERLGLGWIG